MGVDPRGSRIEVTCVVRVCQGAGPRSISSLASCLVTPKARACADIPRLRPPESQLPRNTGQKAAAYIHMYLVIITEAFTSVDLELPGLIPRRRTRWGCKHGAIPLPRARLPR